MKSKNKVAFLTKKNIKKIDNDKLIVTSNALLKAQLPKLTINEQRLILYMLAMLNIFDEDFKVYRIFCDLGLNANKICVILMSLQEQF